MLFMRQMEALVDNQRVKQLIAQTAILGIIIALFFIGITIIEKNTPPPARIAKTKPGNVVFCFFNGVAVTPIKANKELYGIVARYGEKSSHGLVDYDLFYNDTNGVLSDVAEEFARRMDKQPGEIKDHYELFFEAINKEGDLLSKTSRAVPSFASVADDFASWTETTVAAAFVKMILRPDILQKSYRQHQAQLEPYTKAKKKLVFFAHSQGNLFANNALETAAKTRSEVGIVHIAPPTNRRHGEYTLADQDRIISLLKPVTSALSPTTSIPESRGVGKNGKTDWHGHGLFEIYLNDSLDTAERIDNHVMALF